MNLFSTLYPTICLFLLLSTPLFAQINITYPVGRQAVQRGNNQATVQSAGSYSVALDLVEARFVPIQGGQTTSRGTVQNNPTNGQFSRMLTAQGTTCNNSEQCLSPGGATDERVISVPINTNISENPAYSQYRLTADPEFLPGLTFSQWTTNSGVAPFNSNAWLWGRLGDLLVQRLNVPVLFYGAGFGGTHMEYMYLAMTTNISTTVAGRC